ncbi:IS3 family transposase [Natronosporangium hydrolyticum]|uniref:IS3 family transposase n=1 Tax=Natronosporangium hydrolyticum TaxID=2811111 RepID=A0A895YJ77_9ACTN|nr:IS3 family transposase [Natronosporangium hydrolyticum]
MIEEAFVELAPVTGIKQACRLLGKPRSSHYRRLRPAPAGQARPPRPAPPNALSRAERDQVAAVLHSERFADKSPAQVWATLLDEGVYLCSESTMYRILRERGEVRERRRQAQHPPRVRPELVAHGPNEIWSWDITKLHGPHRGVYYDLYVMIDIYSRYVVGWQVAARESGELAEEFIAEAIARIGVAPRAVHADRGTAMTSKPVAALLADLNIDRSHSRPKVSNDNPFSEAQFKTLKHCPAFPGRFGSIADARAFCAEFFTYYNHDHRHRGIGLHTPASVHFGTVEKIREERAKVLDAAYAANPDRFRSRPTPPTIPGAAWINEPPATTQTS